MKKRLPEAEAPSRLNILPELSPEVFPNNPTPVDKQYYRSEVLQ